jgi:molybdopterin synthase catalytic subunit
MPGMSWRCFRRWPGASMPHLTRDPILAAELAERVVRRERGALVTFVGYVRDHHGGRAVLRLEYSAYEPMAEAECARISAAAEGRWPVALAIAHRLGTLEVGEVAVAIAVAGGHRGEAFEACRWSIEEVKRTVPIWKREFYADGTVAWVDPTAATA